MGLSEPGAGAVYFCLEWCSPRERRKEGSLAEPENRSQVIAIIFRKERKGPATATQKFLQMWNLKESRGSEPIFSKSESAHCGRRHRLLSPTFGCAQHCQV